MELSTTNKNVIEEEQNVIETIQYIVIRLG